VSERKSSEKPAFSTVILGNKSCGISTFIGHLLYQCGHISEQRLQEVKNQI
jgi:translation elongation factor EF-1alpha